MCSLFKKGKEVDLFKSKKEMISKIKIYLENEKLRGVVATRGRKKVISNGHDIYSRMKLILSYYANDKN